MELEEEEEENTTDLDKFNEPVMTRTGGKEAVREGKGIL